MKKQIIFTIFALFLLVGITFVSAEIQYFQQKSNIENGTIKNHLTIVYSKGEMGLADDYVSGNNPYEVYLWYNFYPQKWNIDNPNYRVDYCNFQIRFWGKMENTTTLIFNQNYTSEDTDVFNLKYFIKLYNGDGMIADQFCYFENKSYTGLDFPAEMQLVTPTWECKSCQYYEWVVQQQDVVKVKSIGDNIVSISGYIKKLFLLNFEIWLALFWIFLIFMIFIALGLIFMMINFFYLYIKRLAR